MGRLNGAKSDSHSRRSHIGNEPKSDEIGSAMVDADAHLRSARKWGWRLDKTAKDAQVTGDAQNLAFRFHIHDFGLGRKGPPHRAMLLRPHNQCCPTLTNKVWTSLRSGFANLEWVCRYLHDAPAAFPHLSVDVQQTSISNKAVADWTCTLPPHMLGRGTLRRRRNYEIKCPQGTLSQGVAGYLRRREAGHQGPAKDGQGGLREPLARSFSVSPRANKNHISRLEQIFDELDESPKGESCDGMEGLIPGKGSRPKSHYSGRKHQHQSSGGAGLRLITPAGVGPASPSHRRRFLSRRIPEVAGAAWR